MPRRYRPDGANLHHARVAWHISGPANAETLALSDLTDPTGPASTTKKWRLRGEKRERSRWCCSTYKCSKSPQGAIGVWDSWRNANIQASMRYRSSAPAVRFKCIPSSAFEATSRHSRGPHAHVRPETGDRDPEPGAQRLTVVDVYSGECVAIVPQTSFRAEDVRRILKRGRRAPGQAAHTHLCRQRD